VDESEHTYYCHGASLRIYGEIGDLDAISSQLGLEPTHAHRRGERAGPRSPPWPHDMWIYEPPLAEEQPLEEHLRALWRALEPNADYLKGLKEHLTVDVFCGYRSNSGTAGFVVAHDALEIFRVLEVDFGVSVIVG
jgi:hypothetical protein